MPVEITQTCLACHVAKPRDAAFAAVIVGWNKRGKPRRVWMTYCDECLAKYPRLRSDPERLPLRVRPNGDDER